MNAYQRVNLILPDAPVAKDGNWIALDLRSIRSIMGEIGFVARFFSEFLSLKPNADSLLLTMFLSQCFVWKSSTSSDEYIQQFTPRGFVRFLSFNCSCKLLLLSLNLLRTGKGICGTTIRCLVLDHIIVAEFSWPDVE